jgi:hypothetical protein
MERSKPADALKQVKDDPDEMAIVQVEHPPILQVTANMKLRLNPLPEFVFLHSYSYLKCFSFFCRRRR